MISLDWLQWCGLIAMFIMAGLTPVVIILMFLNMGEKPKHLKTITLKTLFLQE